MTKAMIVTPGGAVPLLLGPLTPRTRWMTWDTPGHGTAPQDRARARVQHILDTEQSLARDNGLHVPRGVSFSPCYERGAPVSLIVGVSIQVATQHSANHDMCLAVDEDSLSDPTKWKDIPVPYPFLRVGYSLSLYDIGTANQSEGTSICEYLIPRLHPTEHCMLGGSGPLGLADMMGGVLCTRIEGTQPTNMLRELMRNLGHLPHEFINGEHRHG